MSILAIDQQLLSSSSILRRRREEEEDEDRDEELRPSKALYLPEKPRPVDFYPDEPGGRDISIDGQQHIILAAAAESSGEDPEMKAPKKRAETWVQEETRSLISLRREMDGLFNTSKSNKHLWEQISAKMRDRGFDRSPTMCTDKWRNLLKEFKKAKQQFKGSGSAKMSYYKELDELLKERNRNAAGVGKIDSFMQFGGKGLEDAGVPYGSVEGSGRSTVNLESPLDHNGHHLAITAAATANDVPPWNWRDASGNSNGGDNHASYGGRVILVKCGEYTKRIGIDGTAKAIKEAIKSAFGLRTKRAFWLEDEDEVVRCLDREMPLGTYTLHLDAGVTVKVCMYADNAVRTEDKTFYSGKEFNDYLNRNNWTSLRELNSYRTVLNLDDLRPGVIYQGVRLPDD